MGTKKHIGEITYANLQFLAIPNLQTCPIVTLTIFKPHGFEVITLTVNPYNWDSILYWTSPMPLRKLQNPTQITAKSSVCCCINCSEVLNMPFLFLATVFQSVVLRLVHQWRKVQGVPNILRWKHLMNIWLRKLKEYTSTRLFWCSLQFWSFGPPRIVF